MGRTHDVYIYMYKRERDVVNQATVLWWPCGKDTVTGIVFEQTTVAREVCLHHLIILPEMMQAYLVPRKNKEKDRQTLWTLVL